MLDNITYNLMVQLIEENQSVWKIRKYYLKDVEGNKEQERFWKKILEHKEDHINELEELVATHINRLNEMKETKGTTA